MDLGLGRWVGGSTWYFNRQHSRIDLSLLQHQSKSDGRLLKRGSGDCRTFLCSVTQAAEERQGRLVYRTLPCSVSEQLKALEERHGGPEPFLSA